MNIYDDGEVNTIGGRVYDPRGIMRTLGGGHAMSQPLIIVVEEANEQSDSVGGIGEKRSNKGTQWYQQNRIYDPEGIAPALSKDKSDLMVIINEDKTSDKEGLH